MSWVAPGGLRTEARQWEFCIWDLGVTSEAGLSTPLPSLGCVGLRLSRRGPLTSLLASLT